MKLTVDDYKEPFNLLAEMNESPAWGRWLDYAVPKGCKYADLRKVCYMLCGTIFGGLTHPTRITRNSINWVMCQKNNLNYGPIIRGQVTKQSGELF